MKRTLILVALLLISFMAQAKFSYTDIAAGKFRQKSVSGFRSMSDGEHYTLIENNKIVKYSYATGKAEDVLYEPTHEGKVPYDYRFSADETKILIKYNSRPLYRRSAFSNYDIYDIATGESRSLTHRDSIRFASFSPEGDRVAFVYNNNIYIKDLKKNKETRVTSDGEFNRIINGLPDWVYEEEFVLHDALRWSPDGKNIAFLRFDESKVMEFSFPLYNVPDPNHIDNVPRKMDPGENIAYPYYPKTFTYKYPKAGGSNSIVELYVYNIAGGKTIKVDVGPEKDQYVPFFDWTPDGQLYFFRINRPQNHLEIILADHKGKGRVIYEEKSPKYIDDISLGTITFLSDSKHFIIRNETATGYAHLYMYHADKGYMYPVTSGEWEISELVCATDDRIWYLSTEVSPLTRTLYSVDIDGGGKRRHGDAEGTYRVAPSQGCKYYVSYFSNAATPNTVTLHNGDGSLVRVLEDNAELKAYIAEINLPVKKFYRMPAVIGGKESYLNYYMVMPPDFDETRKYPILLTQYSGPASQQVLDRWNVDWEDALAQEGYIIISLDPRGTGGRGEEFKKLTYGRMGEMETQDHIAFVKWLSERDYVDASRIGVYGWSYGGFMSLNCILHGADVFGMAISVAPVTSWRYYDTIYTERVNNLPQYNPEGYDEPSPIYYADKLKGKLLMMHGSADDNVHLQNAMKMAFELTKHGKQFDMMIYTDDNHSMLPNGRHHIRQAMVDYCLKNL